MILILNDLLFQKGLCGFSKCNPVLHTHVTIVFSFFFNLFSLNLFLITNTFKTFLNFHTNKQLFRPQHYLMTNRIELKAICIFFISNACFFLPQHHHLTHLHYHPQIHSHQHHEHSYLYLQRYYLDQRNLDKNHLDYSHLDQNYMD